MTQNILYSVTIKSAGCYLWRASGRNSTNRTPPHCRPYQLQQQGRAGGRIASQTKRTLTHPTPPASRRQRQKPKERNKTTQCMQQWHEGARLKQATALADMADLHVERQQQPNTVNMNEASFIPHPFFRHAQPSAITHYYGRILSSVIAPRASRLMQGNCGGRRLLNVAYTTTG